MVQFYLQQSFKFPTYRDTVTIRKVWTMFRFIRGDAKGIIAQIFESIHHFPLYGLVSITTLFFDKRSLSGKSIGWIM